jgi:hypothetical protein
MKQLALKHRHSLALVPVPKLAPSEPSAISPVSVRSLSGWWTPGPLNADEPKVRPLTTEDVVQVELATIRESRSHAFWPPEVIARFLQVDLSQ